MDWCKGKSTGKPHDLNGKFYGFRLRFSGENQSIEKIYSHLGFGISFFGHVRIWGCQMGI
jgi:hypothetical protein